MYYSKMLIPTLREDPGEAEVISHRLMLRAGMIRKLAAGVYTYLPLGYRVIHKVEKIIREEMNRAGAQEILLPVMLPAELWKETGRWDQYGKELMRFRDRHERDFCLGPTHEEAVTDLVRKEVRSYRQLPICLYQIQTKFRDEIRPRFGLMRGREFIMKDAYSFDRDDPGAEESYRRMDAAYHRIFERCGLNFRSVEADSGLIGGSFSHEFMVLAETGEDAIAACDRCRFASNVERPEVKEAKEGDPCPRCREGRLQLPRGIEVGHIFKLGTKYSQAMGAGYLDEEGKEQPMVMGCYGIGVGRTAAAAIEQNHDANGIRWPVALAPFQVILLPLQKDSEQVRIATETAYEALTQKGIEVLLDDRDERPGVKFKDADLIGIPCQVVLGERGLREGVAEIKNRRTGEQQKVPADQLMQTIISMTGDEFRS
ncbi:MAG: proline--tRNA ligase [Nitrospirae bacterium]|nr:proline--tRNA ligase [Nitrospirota bacterium]